MVLFMYLINVYMLQALHKDKVLELLKESFEKGRNQDYETWMGRECQIYSILRFDHITQDLQVPPADAGEGSSRRERRRRSTRKWASLLWGWIVKLYFVHDVSSDPTLF